MLETVSHNPELDFKMNILQLVKVQIVKGIKHLMATAAQICHRIKSPIHILLHSKMNTVMKRKTILKNTMMKMKTVLKNIMVKMKIVLKKGSKVHLNKTLTK